MKELVEVIAKSLVDYPEQVVVTETETDRAIGIGTARCAVRYGQSNRQAGTYCKSNSFRCKSSSLKGRKESYC